MPPPSERCPNQPCHRDKLVKEYEDDSDSIEPTNGGAAQISYNTPSGGKSLHQQDFSERNLVASEVLPSGNILPGDTYTSSSDKHLIPCDTHSLSCNTQLPSGGAQVRSCRTDSPSSADNEYLDGTHVPSGKVTSGFEPHKRISVEQLECTQEKRQKLNKSENHSRMMTKVPAMSFSKYLSIINKDVTSKSQLSTIKSELREVEDKVDLEQCVGDPIGGTSWVGGQGGELESDDDEDDVAKVTMDMLVKCITHPDVVSKIVDVLKDQFASVSSSKIKKLI